MQDYLFVVHRELKFITCIRCGCFNVQSGSLLKNWREKLILSCGSYFQQSTEPVSVACLFCELLLNYTDEHIALLLFGICGTFVFINSCFLISIKVLFFSTFTIILSFSFSNSLNCGQRSTTRNFCAHLCHSLLRKNHSFVTKRSQKFVVVEMNLEVSLTGPWSIRLFLSLSHTHTPFRFIAWLQTRYRKVFHQKFRFQVMIGQDYPHLPENGFRP